MTDHRQVMKLLLDEQSYRQIAALLGCAPRTISKARRVLADEKLVTIEQVDALSAEDIYRLFSDGRKSVTGEFVPVDVDAILAARLGRKEPPLKVLWAKYLQIPAAPGLRHYGYERFCQLVAVYVRVNDLTARLRPIAWCTDPGGRVAVDVATVTA